MDLGYICKTLGRLVLLSTLIWINYGANGKDHVKCVRCSHVSSPHQCHDHHECDDYESCFAAVSLQDGKEVYSAGCSRSHWLCQHQQKRWLLGNLASGSYHQECCHEDMCNAKLIQTIHLSEVSTAKPSSNSHLPQPATIQVETTQTTVSTTTSTPPKTTTTTTTTTAKPFILSEGIRCHVCSGERCGLTDNDPVMQCPDSFPYCMNVVMNDASGNKFVNKRCASAEECKGGSQQSHAALNGTVCKNFDAAEIYQSSFECSYCCETSFCNKHVIPPAETIASPLF